MPALNWAQTVGQTDRIPQIIFKKVNFDTILIDDKNTLKITQNGSLLQYNQGLSFSIKLVENVKLISTSILFVISLNHTLNTCSLIMD